MVFSTNQVRQLYVVNKFDTATNVRALVTAQTGYPDPDPQKVGTTAVVKIYDYDNPAAHTSGLCDAFELLYVNVDGEIMHSDIIKRDNIRSIRMTPAAKLRKPLQTWTIKLGADGIDGGANTITDPQGNSFAANDKDVYYFDFSFPGFQNATDEEIETKTVAFQWKTGDWSDAAVEAIKLAFKKRNNLDNKLVNVVKVDATTIEVWAPEGGPWINGLHDNKPNRIEISVPEVEMFSIPGLSSLPLGNNSRVIPCGCAVDTTASTTHLIGNAKMTADLEYFCMGERGDQYRMMGWPNYVPTRYMIGPNVNAQTEYDYLDIHYYFQGEGVRSDKSEKVLTLVGVSPLSSSGDGGEKGGNNKKDGSSSSTYNEDLLGIYEMLLSLGSTGRMPMEDVAAAEGTDGEYVDNDDVITIDDNYTAGELSESDGGEANPEDPGTGGGDESLM